MSTLLKRTVSLTSSAALALAGLGVVAVAAEAAPAVIQPRPDTSITADRLPTVQMNGVVWSTAVAGNKVYAGGSFTRARPAGAAAGTNETVRNNLLAFDITTGNLDTSFVPDLNGQVLGVAVSPDNSRVYVVGDFTTANGQARRRVAAYSTATGALITSFNPVGVSNRARAVAVTDDTVYVGGSYGAAGSASRDSLAAFRASDGALLSWAPSAERVVWGLAVSPDGADVYAGGQFTTINGQPAYGLAKINATTGVLDSAWQPQVRNAGDDAAVGSLRIQNNALYGTSWHFGPGGNLEGAFKIPLSAPTGSIDWVTECHGDDYSVFLHQGIVYTAGHAHYCGNVGGHPQYPDWKFQHSQAWSDTVTGEILNDAHGYYNWHGLAQSPALVHWLPSMTIGSYTGQYQAGWTITGNDDFVVYGGEFPRVNGVGQQGLVRFGKRPVAPGTEGPTFASGSFAPQVTARTNNSARISWPTASDRDDRLLTYKLYRGGVVINTQTVASNWWTLPALGYVDTGLTPGSSYSYLLNVSDPGGNTVWSSTASYTQPTNVAVPNAYAQSVLSSGAELYWPLNDVRSGSSMTVRDRAGFNDGVAGTDVSAGQAGAIADDTAMSFGNAQPSQSLGRIYAKGTQYAPDAFTLQAWIKTDTTAGGRILGFGDLQEGDSGHRDRQLYMTNAGKLVFGVRAQDNSARTISTAKSYNDNQWHQVSASMDEQGMALYVDGVRVGKRSDTTQGETYLGYWRVQGDNLDGWPSRPSNTNFVGSIDEVAVYPTALGQATILSQYELSGRTSVVPPAPADAYGATVYQDDPDLFWRFNEASGTSAADSGRSLNDGTYRSGVTLGADGVIAGNAAAQFDGSDDVVTSDGVFSNPTVYSLEAWFRTTTNAGGKIIGFGGSQSGNSSNYDRHVYMLGNGHLVFGVWTGQMNTIETAASFNDNEWHHVVASQATGGMKLYVDGQLQGTNPQAAAQDYDGYWRVGGDTSWGGAPYFNGVIDEAAVYGYELAQDRIVAHYQAGGGQPNQAPTADFTSTVNQRRVAFAGSGTDADGTIAAYAWNFGDGTTSADQNPTHIYTENGSYAVTLTVTDNKGATGEVTHQVTVTAPAGPNDTYGASVYADHPRLYWRLDEASGTTAHDVGGGLSNGSIVGGPALGVEGAIGNDNTAMTFNPAPVAGQYVTSDDSFANPTVYSEEAWFRTSSGGGKIMGFGCSVSSPSSCYDRHVYLQQDGKLVFGTYTGQMNTIVSDASYTDGQWHHVVATQSSGGMKLYVDGALVGSNPQTSAEAYTGWLHVGGDNTWDNSGVWFEGDIDEVAFYLHELSASRVLAHYQASQPVPNQPPVAAFEVTQNDLAVSVDASGSSDPDGSVTGYQWNFGDGTTASDVTAGHSYAAPGSYTITLTVTDNQGATGTTSRSVTVTAANVTPVAAFAATVDALTVAVDGSGSSDPDGTITGYQWTFGDGSTATGATASHSYATAGTFTITLTVTDNRGGTDSTSHQVTTTAPPNQAPQADFVYTVNDLNVAFDAGTSQDQDGTITGYAWEFGDGATGTGVTTSHSYAGPGSYQVTLTVTDNGGATGTTTIAVTVTAPTVLASDSFNRVVTNGWGMADVGGVWTPGGSGTNLAVNGGGATLRMNAGAGPAAYLNGISAGDVEMQGSVSYDKSGTGGGIYTSFVARRNGTTDYRATVRVQDTQLFAQLVRTVNGTETVLTNVSLPGGGLAIGSAVNVKFQVTGTNGTTLRMKVWRAGQTEPTTWTSSVVDTTAALQGAGSVGLHSYLSGSATASPIMARFTDFVVKPA
ncbi:MAG: PKD domain-containing protein [Propionicimonas sp.]|uniref:PKD domain-containing protein n=1 Tax=Propionicimonas sp. TaxID=1955623 RepID=UPI002B21DA41|nr:PKD domain-containing protein [Propionicimonas sp.]MEA4944772.1 PKD domain-containing protein [Propionicimonas sp.]